MRKFLLLFVVVISLCAVASQIQGYEWGIKPTGWRFDLIRTEGPVIRTIDGDMMNFWKFDRHEIWHLKPHVEDAHSIEQSCGGSFCNIMIYFGRIGIGTNVVESNFVNDYTAGEFTINHVHYSWGLRRHNVESFHPIILHFVPYSRPTNYGNLSLYGYLKKSLKTKAKERFYEHLDRGNYYAETHGSSYWDIGICLAYNPLRFIPVELRLGMIRIDFGPYKEIPQPYKDYMPLEPISYYYASLDFSFGYWSIR